MCGLLNSCHVPGRWTSSRREGQVKVPHCLSQDHGHKGPWQWALGHLKGQNLVPPAVTFDWLDPSRISLYSQCPSGGYTVTHLTREEIQPPETGAIRLRARGLALPLHCLKKELQARPRNSRVLLPEGALSGHCPLGHTSCFPASNAVLCCHLLAPPKHCRWPSCPVTLHPRTPPRVMESSLHPGS